MFEFIGWLLDTVIDWALTLIVIGLGLLAVAVLFWVAPVLLLIAFVAVMCCRRK